MPKKTELTLACICAIGILVSGGLLYRKYSREWVGVDRVVLELPVPLEGFPLDLAGWQGQELETPATTEAYMRTNFADDFFCRRYLNYEKNAYADVYVVYCASRPAGILGHRPRVCYIGQGWYHDGTETLQLLTSRGKTVPCLLHRFYQSVPNYRESVALSFYVVSGGLTEDEDEIVRKLGRRPNTEGDYARYVAQVQISSQRERDVREAASDMIDAILDFLPDEEGRVLAEPLSAP